MISRDKLSHLSANDRGFTLVELLVVIALIGLIGLFALPNMNSYFKLSLNSATREMATIIKEAYNGAVMTGRVHRLVYDIKEQSYWVESGPSTLLLDTNESKDIESRKRKLGRADDKKKSSGFSLDRLVTRKKMALPRGVEFEDVLTEQSPNPITEGTTYTHLFPHGISEQTLIHLQDSQKHKVTLAISPITGKTRVIDGYVTAKEIFGE